MFGLLFFFGFIFNSPLRAQSGYVIKQNRPNYGSVKSCKPLNLISQKNSPFKKIPHYNQGKTTLCYAYVASQLVDYDLLKKGASKAQVHPLWLALTHAEMRGKSSISFGLVEKAIESMQTGRYCDYDIVSKALIQWMSKANATEEELIEIIEKITPSGKGIPGDRACIENPAFSSLIQELESMNLMNSVDVVKKLLFPVCEASSKLEVNPVAEEFMAKSDPEKTEQMLNYILSKNNAPLGVSYCVKYKGEKCEFSHVSLLVGKKKVGGHCHFLERNTLGDTWINRKESSSCFCKNRKSGSFVDGCTAQTHSDKDFSVEGCWVSAEERVPHILDMTFIESHPHAVIP